MTGGLTGAPGPGSGSVAGGDDVDVVVAGGGPAGSAAAILLAGAGLRVVLADPGRRGAFAGGESLPAAARPLLRDLGVWEAFGGEGHLRSTGSRSAWGSAAVEGHPAVNDPYGSGWLLDRERFDAFLRGAAAGAGARVVRASVGVAPADGGWVATLGDARVACRWLVDATGRGAAVARRLGARRAVDDDAVAWVARYACLPGDVDATTLVEAVPDGWWYTARVPDGLRVVAYVTDADLPPPDLAAFGAGTAHVAPLLGALADSPLRVSARAGMLVPFAGEGWVAAGDAALAFDPLSSQGILTALFSGVHAAGAVLAALDGSDTAVPEYAERLAAVRAAYERNRSVFYLAETRWPDAPFWRRRR